MIKAHFKTFFVWDLNEFLGLKYVRENVQFIMQVLKSVLFMSCSCGCSPGILIWG